MPSSGIEIPLQSVAVEPLKCRPHNDQVHVGACLMMNLQATLHARARATLASAAVHLVVGVTQIRTVPSLLPAARDLPSGLKAIASTRP